MRSLLLMLVSGCLAVSALAQSKPPKLSLGHQASGRSPAAFLYAFETASEPYADLTNPISINNGEVWDDPVYLVSLPFPAMINALTVTDLQFIGLGAAFNGITEVPEVFGVLAPFETDLIDRGWVTGISQSPISYQVDGDPGQQIFKMEWNNAGSYDEMDISGTNNMFINFQLWLYEETGAIEFRFGPSLIEDPAIFYSGLPGALSGFASYNVTIDSSWDSHFLTDNAASPVLVELDPENPAFLDGTPPNGTVYRFTVLSMDTLAVTINATNGTCGVPNGSATAEAAGGIEPYAFLWSTGDTVATIMDLVAGIYEVTVTDSLGTTGSASVEITNVEEVVANTGWTNETAYQANDGTAWSAPLGGTPPFTYVWSTGATDSLITGLMPGNYRVTVTDVNGCTDWEAVDVQPYICPELAFEFAVTDLKCNSLCEGAISVFSITGGFGPYSFAWSNGDTLQSTDSLCAGTYMLTITDIDGCPTILSFEVTEPEALAANAGSTNESGEDLEDGTAWAAPTGGVGSYAYAWNTGATDSLITGLTPGIYTVTVTDGNNCETAQIVLVNAFGCPELSIEGLIWNAKCTGDCDGVIQLSDIVNGSGQITYWWSTGDSTSVVDSLCYGSYTVIVGDTAQCFAMETFVLSEDLLLQANAGSTDEMGPNAEDGTAWAAPTGGLAPYSYTWSTGSTDSLITNLAPGEYTVIVTESGAACADTQTVVVLEFLCTLEIELLSAPTCFGACTGSAEVNIIGGVEPFQYVWSSGDTTILGTGLCAGTHYITVTDGEGCVVIDSVVIESLDELFANAGNTDETANGANDGTAWAAPTGGFPAYTYAWSNGATDSLITDLAPGVYQVTVTDGAGCQATDLVMVNAFGCPEFNPDVEIWNANCSGDCDGVIEIHDVLNATPPFTYAWSTGSDTSIVTDLCAGDYTVTIGDANGCFDILTFTIPEQPLFSVEAGATDETAPGANDGTAWAIPNGGIAPYSYAWSNGSTDSLIIGLMPGTYSVIVTESGGGCADTLTVVVNAFQCPDIAAESSISLACAGSCDGAITISPAGGTPPYTYQWSTGDTTEAISDLCPGDYAVTIFDALNCMGTIDFTIEALDPLLANAGSTDETGNGSSDGTAWAAPTGGAPPYFYQWSTGATDSLITNLDGGVYSVTVTDAAGCIAIEEVTVETFICATLSLSETPISCFNICDGAVVVEVSGGVGPFEYLWNTGDTTDAISGLCPGPYSVFVLDLGQDCPAFIGTTLIQPDELLVSVDQVVHLTDTTIASVDVTVTGGTPPYLYFWNGPDGFVSTDQDISGVDEGFYKFSVRDAHDCAVEIDSIEIRDDRTVGVKDLPTLDVRLYPNPATQQVSLDMPDVQTFEVIFLQASGQLIRTFNNTRTLDIHDLPQGYYLVRITSDQGTYTGGLVIMHE